MCVGVGGWGGGWGGGATRAEAGEGSEAEVEKEAGQAYVRVSWGSDA